MEQESDFADLPLGQLEALGKTLQEERQYCILKYSEPVKAYMDFSEGRSFYDYQETI